MHQFRPGEVVRCGEADMHKSSETLAAWVGYPDGWDHLFSFFFLVEMLTSKEGSVHIRT